MAEHEAETVVVRERTLDSTPDEVWETLTDEALLEQWLADEVELDLREGGRARFRWDGGDARDAELERIEPGERLSLRWWSGTGDAGQVDFRLEPVERGTRLVVIETRSGRGATAGPWCGPRLAALAGLHARLVCV